MADSNVVCRQLACGSALLAKGGAAFSPGNGAIWLGEVKCTGSESFLSDCPSSLPAQSDCDHKEDVSVICSGLDLSLNSSSSTPSGEKVQTTSIPVAVCIALGVLLICELITLMVVRQRKLKRKGTVTRNWGSPAGLYQGIYEEIDHITSGKNLTLAAGSVYASIDSLNQMDYFTSRSLGDTDPGSENPEENYSKVQGPVPGNDDDVETESIHTLGGPVLLGSCPDDLFTLRGSGGGLSSLEYSSQTRTDPGFPFSSMLGNNKHVHPDTSTASEGQMPMSKDRVSQSVASVTSRE
ncbi:antigen WC1.1-like [Carcharodon carcharias]|uniref:antigen WC1.1-like n=1 Tax=Carcharodon carcharias TaxID=13397 RepID=UPI001B7EB4A2|nr:antigen WC1.1-like [Carcharodon carcharias]